MEFSPACVTLQETKLGDSSYSSPHGYHGVYSTSFPEQGHHGGTAIRVRQDTPIVPFSASDSPQNIRSLY
ncbi:hypothetical protein E2C01_089848 [Portunus trituberculatus]|uniref:Uncharacterized protein n=1 Tax=Portunus trituberculatus TaxID=210409 RepID=A0A5B7JIL2_PORTR|nr:hypothetical protein [Portunus trituberculatus]